MICRSARVCIGTSTPNRCAGRGPAWEARLRRLGGGQKDQYLMVDLLIVRAHQRAVTDRKKRL